LQDDEKTAAEPHPTARSSRIVRANSKKCNKKRYNLETGVSAPERASKPPVKSLIYPLIIS
jgi:hypothetical protein